MAESIIFHCDMCGQKSEEEPAALPRRERCRVELVFRGQRFVLAPPQALEAPAIPWGALPLPADTVVPPAPWPPLWPAGIPGAPAVGLPPEGFAQPAEAAASPEEDDRAVYTICDACMKRACAFFDLKAEAFEEYSARVAREAELARRASAPLPTGGGMKGEMVSQYPTRTREPGHGPGPGGLVDQFPTPGPNGAKSEDKDKPADPPPPPPAEA
ncbi:MAG TPA: hypothetical protein VFA98_06460 [Thermoanaerobaculia bacterium]|jgi:hypothetical protein|nr:hypothetical protein [Thermoanaerobaculia bacterium]